MLSGRFVSYHSTSRCGLILTRLFCVTSELFVKIAVVGSGPAGFYLSGPLLREIPECSVDIFERLPVPFGLIRYGVAPDHPEVKNCIHHFEDLMKRNAERCRFFGNVTVGTDISVAALRKAYDVVCFAYGADSEKSLGIPGESLSNCFSARQFVGWYNGHPEQANLNPRCLDCEAAIILGHGNVSLDVARILLSPIEELKKSDIPENVLKHLEQSKIGKVVTVGRRGPLQVAFTIKELREMIRLPRVCSKIDWEGVGNIENISETLQRPRRRLTELLWKTHKAQKSSGEKNWELRFCRTPKEILGAGKVEGIEFSKNRLQESKPVVTDETEVVNCGLVVYSIGYKSVAIDGLPFDSDFNVVKTEPGSFRVKGKNELQDLKLIF